MSLTNELLRILAAIDPVIPMAAVILVLTLILLAVSLSASDMLWINQRRFKVFGIFYGLNGYNSYRLAISWIRMLMAVCGIIAFREMTAVEYVVFLGEALLYIADVRKAARILKNLLWAVLQFAGLLSVNLLCGYLKVMVYASARIWVVYIFLVVFLVLFSLFLFLNELEVISQDREAERKEIVHERQ